MVCSNVNNGIMELVTEHIGIAVEGEVKAEVERERLYVFECCKASLALDRLTIVVEVGLVDKAERSVRLTAAVIDQFCRG